MILVIGEPYCYAWWPDIQPRCKIAVLKSLNVFHSVFVHIWTHPNVWNSVFKQGYISIYIWGRQYCHILCYGRVTWVWLSSDLIWMSLPRLKREVTYWCEPFITRPEDDSALLHCYCCLNTGPVRDPEGCVSPQTPKELPNNSNLEDQGKWQLSNLTWGRSSIIVCLLQGLGLAGKASPCLPQLISERIAAVQIWEPQV